MLLPKISTNMSVWAQEPDADPLKLYLNSLNLFEPLPDDTVVLPSHGKPFGAAPGSTEGGIRTRLQQLREHHDARLQETLEACRNPASAADVMPVLFKRKLDLHQLTFALGETIAHLNHLWHAGKVTRSEDAQGRLKFTAI
jgi:glyoxylase-like metal-dependent hydrolase (beta-lactamase superfamily II)